jgi:NAD(P)-dependent dehydrogenase (short-subunit alcohol dehydrogenase family)
MQKWSIRDKVVLITGGNTGIGKAVAIELLRRDARVVFTSRDEKKAERAKRDIELATGKAVDCLRLDLASFESIRSCAGDFLERYPSLHVLINNAGLILGERRETAQGFEMTLGVNHVGHFLLTNLLLDRLKASAPARIINVASDAHRRAPLGLNFSDLQSRRRYHGLLVYARSKLANIYFTRALAKRLEGSRVTVNAVHPGVVGTEFALDGDTSGLIQLFYRFLGRFLLTPEQGAKTIVYCAAEPDLQGVSGKYFWRRRIGRPSLVARNERHAEQLWEATVRWIQEERPDDV